MSNNGKQIAALLTVHNRKEKTLSCLNRLFSQKMPQDIFLTVYLTDDGCTDGTKESVTKLFPQVNIVYGDGSLYWNRGMYMAWNEAAKRDYDYYLWLNDDTFLYDNTLSKLLETSYSHQDNAIVVGATSAIGQTSDITYGGYIDGKLIIDVSRESKCNTFNGNIVLIPQYVFKTIGTNDPYYRHSLGDMDYGLMACKNGIEIWIAQGVMGECDCHDKPSVWMDPSQPFMKRWKNYFSPTGRNPFEFFYFRKKHFGFLAACKTFVSNFIHFLFPTFWKI